MRQSQQDIQRVLIIDDNQAIHDDIRKILRSDTSASSAMLDGMEAQLFGDITEPETKRVFEIDSAYQGQEGLDKVKEALKTGRPYALAFVDVRMPPGWDGIETISYLWDVEPNLQIVICTAYSDHSWEDIVQRLGQSDRLLILKKPFDALSRKWLLHWQVQQRLADLEVLVRNRTIDLQQANDKLKTEIGERRKAEDELKHLATHDSLTDLPNRILLHDRINQAIARASRFKHSIAVILLDLDHFKEVNDSLGHKSGDFLLRMASKRLLGCIRECDTVARLGGDEFVILLDDLAKPEDAGIIAQRILESFNDPIQIDNHQIPITPSLGISVYPSDCNDVENLLKSADLAMYHVKNTGRNGYHFFSPSMKTQLVEKLELKAQLKIAVEKMQFVMRYQPLFSIKNGKICGMEALMRWNHPDLGLVEPMEFISQAEESGLIIPIGNWALREACTQNKAWQNAGFIAVPIAVNISTRQLHDKGLLSTVESVLQETGLHPQFIELELTESSAMMDINSSHDVLNQLHDLGVRIIIDDFGSGFSSLSRLKSLPINGIKIDHFFIQHVVEDVRDAAIVRAIIALARSLKIEVIAEGIETKEQLAFLKDMRWDDTSELSCDKAQGFLLSKPVSADEMEKFFQV